MYFPLTSNLNATRCIYGNTTLACGLTLNRNCLIDHIHASHMLHGRASTLQHTLAVKLGILSHFVKKIVTKSLSKHLPECFLGESKFSNISGEACPQTPLDGCGLMPTAKSEPLPHFYHPFSALALVFLKGSHHCLLSIDA